MSNREKKSANVPRTVPYLPTPTTGVKSRSPFHSNIHTYVVDTIFSILPCPAGAEEGGVITVRSFVRAKHVQGSKPTHPRTHHRQLPCPARLNGGTSGADRVSCPASPFPALSCPVLSCPALSCLPPSPCPSRRANVHGSVNSASLPALSTRRFPTHSTPLHYYRSTSHPSRWWWCRSSSGPAPPCRLIPPSTSTVRTALCWGPGLRRERGIRANGKMQMLQRQIRCERRTYPSIQR